MSGEAAQAILAELRALRREVASVAVDVQVVREAVLGLGDRVGRLERARLTPIPAGCPSDSWLPDHGDGGRYP